MRTRRDILAALGAGVVTGVAGCSSDGDTNTTNPRATGSPEDQDTPQATSTEEKGEPTEEDNQAQESEPGFRENIPVDGLELYESRLEEAAGPNGEAAYTTEDIVNALEGATDDPHVQGEHLLENLIGMTRDEMEVEETYELAHSFHTHYQEIQKQTDIDVSNIIFNINTNYNGDIDQTQEIYPFNENGNLQLPVFHENETGPNLSETGLTQKPGETNEKDTGYLPRLRDSSDAAVMIAQDQEGIEASHEHHNPSPEQLRKGRENVQEDWSQVMPGVSPDKDVIPYSPEDRETIYESLYKDPESDLAMEAFAEFQSSDLVDSDAVVSIEVTEGGSVEMREHDDFKYGDQLPGAA